MMRIIRKVHAFLGALLSLLFLIWFLSGFMMMFTSFPRLGGKDAKHKTEINGEGLPSLEKILSCLPEGEQLSSFRLTTIEDKPVLDLKTPNAHYLLSADSLLKPIESKVSDEWIISYAERWSSYPIMGIDTLRTLDAWTPYSSLKKKLPIYRFRYSDPEKTYLYISSKSGEPLQTCTKTQRLKASLGTIPHMLYFWQLRQNRDLWLLIVSILAGLGAIMTLTGLIVGVQVYVQKYKRSGQLRSPYKKKAYKWHHIFGTIFGFFVMMFALSGMMSLNDLPEWMVKQHNPHLKNEIRKKDKLEIQSFLASDYRDLMKLKNVQEITFQQFGQTPYFIIIHSGEASQYRLSSDGKITPLFFSEDEVKKRIARHLDSTIEIELMQEYDNYYCSTSGKSELPIYRIKANDPDKSIIYVSPTTGYTRYYNTSGRVKKWIYPAFHSLRFKFFANHPTFRMVLMMILVLGGSIVSATGVWMGIKYYYRAYRRMSKRKR